MRERSSAAGSRFDDAAARSGSWTGSSMGCPRIGCSTPITSAGLCHQRGALLEQAIAAFAARIERRAGHGKYLAALFECHSRRDERSGPSRRLDHDHAQGKARDQAVAAWKVARARFPAERHLGNQRPLGANGFSQTGMLRRVDAIMAARQYGDRARGQRGPMRGAINAACQTGCNAKAGFTEFAREALGKFDAGGGRIASAHDCDQGQRERRTLAAYRKQRWGIVDHLQPQRIVALSERHKIDAQCLRRAQLSLSLRTGQNARCAGGATAARHLRQPFKRSARAAAMIDKGPKGARTHVFAAYEPQPVDPLLLSEFKARLVVAHVILGFAKLHLQHDVVSWGLTTSKRQSAQLLAFDQNPLTTTP